MITAGLFLLLSPLSFLLAFASDLIQPGPKYSHSRAVMFFAHYLICESWGIVAAGVIWLGTCGGLLVGRETYRKLNYALQKMWSGFLFLGARKIFAIRVEFEKNNDEIRTPQILLVRHASTADTVLAAVLLANPFSIRFRYVLKSELLWDPCLDLVGNRLPNAFVNRFANDMKTQVELVSGLCTDLSEQDGILIYPEGTRYTAAKYKAAMGKLAKQGRQDLMTIADGYKNVLPPRPAGTRALIENAPQAQVAILGHTGFEGARSFGEFWRGGLIGNTIHAKLWLYDPQDIPAGSQERDLWLYEQWSEVDAWIESKKSSTATLTGGLS